MAFPRDCWNIDCEYKHVYDLSVDDLVIVCRLMGIECDACEMHYALSVKCPKEEV